MFRARRRKAQKKALALLCALRGGRRPVCQNWSRRPFLCLRFAPLEKEMRFSRQRLKCRRLFITPLRPCQLFY